MDDRDKRRELLRLIPQVDALLARETFRLLEEEIGVTRCGKLLKEALARKRTDILEDRVKDESALAEEKIAEEVQALYRQEERGMVHPLLNASGIVLHTNLGRAPLSPEISERIRDIACRYSNLEYRLESGRRGSRYDSVAPLLCELTGAEDALVVNNNAAAVLLVLAEMTRGREVIVSRGELVEIGGAFRVPEVMEQSGAILKEVGTTNKVRLSDYRRAIGENTGAILKVHRSNFTIQGFTEEVSPEELRILAREHDLPMIYDLGSGLLHPDPPACLSGEPSVRQAMRADCDIVCFSGDKLLGGPQAGIIIGRKQYIERIKSHPLTRALRCDKMTLLALQEVLRVYLDPERVNREIPLYRMLSLSIDEMEEKADILIDLLRQGDIEAELIHLDGEVGGGSAPAVRLPSAGIALEPLTNGFDLMELETRLRMGEPAVIAYVRKEQLVFDLRTIAEAELETLARAILAAMEKRETL